MGKSVYSHLYTAKSLLDAIDVGLWSVRYDVITHYSASRQRTATCYAGVDCFGVLYDRCRQAINVITMIIRALARNNRRGQACQRKPRDEW